MIGDLIVALAILVLILTVVDILILINDGLTADPRSSPCPQWAMRLPGGVIYWKFVRGGQ